MTRPDTWRTADYVVLPGGRPIAPAPFPRGYADQLVAGTEVRVYYDSIGTWNDTTDCDGVDANCDDASDDAAAASGGRITFEPGPVDATSVPPTLRGFRTLFNACHHFRPEMARQILADARRARQPIGVFEVVSREALPLLGLCTAPLGVLLTMPFWRPFRWQWILWTWIVPILPLFVLWDGLVSWLRIYSEDELRELVADLEDEGYTWEICRIRLGGAPVHATWLVGRPLAP